MKRICCLIISTAVISFLHAQNNLPPGKDVLQLQNGKTIQTNILFQSAGKYYFTDTAGNVLYLNTDVVSMASGKIPERKDYGGYHQNMLHVYNNAAMGSTLLLSGVAVAGFGALISAAFNDSQDIAVPLMAMGGIASLTGLVTLTITFHQRKYIETKMVAEPY